MAKEPIPYIACFGLTEATVSLIESEPDKNLRFLQFQFVSDFFSISQTNKKKIKAILFESNEANEFGIAIKKQLDRAGYSHLPFSVMAEEVPPALVRTLMQEGITEVFKKSVPVQAILKKLTFIIENHSAKEAPARHQYKTPVGKRIFDIAVASLVLLLLLPVFLIIALLIRIESKGPVFYYSLRVGTGYKIFRFYKFRSMSVGADAKLSSLKHLNQYSASDTAAEVKVKEVCELCVQTGTMCQSALYADSQMWCEKLYKDYQQTNAQQAFVKIKDDPRVTRIGKFIRNTSIDELPQLWNVVKGDMSLVGNRPLPLYEAEKLTTDKYALRFMAPAGITGLWQVSKRGKGSMSEEERIGLDNDYANNYGLLFDLKLLLKTIPALLQKENV